MTPYDIKKKIQEQNLQTCKDILAGNTQGTLLKDNHRRIKPVFKVKPELSFDKYLFKGENNVSN